MTLTTRKYLLAVAVTVLTWTEGQGIFQMICKAFGAEYLDGMSLPACFSTVNLGKGLVSADVAENLCRDISMVLPFVQSKVIIHQI